MPVSLLKPVKILFTSYFCVTSGKSYFHSNYVHVASSEAMFITLSFYHVSPLPYSY